MPRNINSEFLNTTINGILKVNLKRFNDYLNPYPDTFKYGKIFETHGYEDYLQQLFLDLNRAEYFFSINTNPPLYRKIDSIAEFESTFIHRENIAFRRAISVINQNIVGVFVETINNDENLSRLGISAFAGLGRSKTNHVVRITGNYLSVSTECKHRGITFISPVGNKQYYKCNFVFRLKAFCHIVGGLSFKWTCTSAYIHISDPLGVPLNMDQLGGVMSERFENINSINSRDFDKRLSPVSRITKGHPDWVRDPNRCQICNQVLKMFFRHHCRQCGRVVCNNCTNSKGFSRIKFCIECNPLR